MADIVKKVYYKNSYSATRLRGIEQKSLFEDFEIQGWVIYVPCFILLSLGLTELLAYFFGGFFLRFQERDWKILSKNCPITNWASSLWFVKTFSVSAGVTYFQYTYILSGAHHTVIGSWSCSMCWRIRRADIFRLEYYFSKPCRGQKNASDESTS